ncbi:HpcH/HpaI aldolase/citrate lyase family protein [Massilia endophytica]|uniref:HpcH/HpaI aldolase/citrate lyase family protein n=1 Tax=Massilia endophytica TaxID=2899220 RepID=UPI001E5D9263|nr:CoA ester lyase [Massilia endophytica]UGQ48000.1 CoA ester lyase [Massilia endophytica]
MTRSYLFVPGNRPERFGKACAAGAGAVIVDLEDAVPAEAKAGAREALAAWLEAATPGVPLLVRINSADSAWFADDLAMCRLAGPRLAGIVLPKAERLDHIARAASAAAVYPLIETAAGIAAVEALAAGPRVERLMFGSIDFALDLGITDEREGLLLFRSRLVLASRLAGLGAPVDGVTTAIDDEARIGSDACYARGLGFGAKLCIHPRQLAAVHAAFSPSAEDVAWARRVVDAAQASNGAAVAVDGRMIDRPVILAAEQILKSL